MNLRASLWQRYQILAAMDPGVRQRDAAALLGVSEAELLLALPGCQPLAPELQPLLQALLAFGPVRAVTRNQAAVLEQDGRYADFSLTEKVGLMLNPGGLDLRIFVRHWQHAFAVEHQTAAGRIQRSVQFYDEYGSAVHKVYLKDPGEAEKWAAMLQPFVRAQSLATPSFLPLPVPQDKVAVAADPARFAEDWLAMNDVHQFSGLLKKHALSRRQGFQHAPGGYADLLVSSSPQQLLLAAAEQGIPIMMFVGNRGLVQIFTGAIHTVKVIDEWLNVLDPGCNLHLRSDLVAEIWRVRRPTRDGVVTSVELLDARGETLITFFGQRSEGSAERTDWRRLSDSLQLLEPDHVA